jgi:hypothetical protein
MVVDLLETERVLSERKGRRNYDSFGRGQKYRIGTAVSESLPFRRVFEREKLFRT